MKHLLPEEDALATIPLNRALIVVVAGRARGFVFYGGHQLALLLARKTHMSSTSNRAPAGTPNFRHASKKLRMLLVCRKEEATK